MGKRPVGDPHGVDPALRDRVIKQIPNVTDALEAAVANPTDDMDKLREVIDCRATWKTGPLTT